MASCYASKIAKKPENIGLLRLLPLLRLKTPLPEEDLCPKSSPSPLLAAQLRLAEGVSPRLHVSLSPRLLRRLRVSASFEMPSAPRQMPLAVRQYGPSTADSTGQTSRIPNVYAAWYGSTG